MIFLLSVYWLKVSHESKLESIKKILISHGSRYDRVLLTVDGLALLRYYRVEFFAKESNTFRS